MNSKDQYHEYTQSILECLPEAEMLFNAYLQIVEDENDRIYFTSEENRYAYAMCLAISKSDYTMFSKILLQKESRHELRNKMDDLVWKCPILDMDKIDQDIQSQFDLSVQNFNRVLEKARCLEEGQVMRDIAQSD